MPPRLSPSGPAISKRVRQTYNLSAFDPDIPAFGLVSLVPATLNAFQTGVQVGDTVTVTWNDPTPAPGILFSGAVVSSGPLGIVAVFAHNTTPAPIPPPPPGFDLTVEVFFA